MDTKTYLKTTPYETEADKFAIELLVPKKLKAYFPDIMSAIKETIQITSELSPTVNNRMFYQIIQLDE